VCVFRVRCWVGWVEYEAVSKAINVKAKISSLKPRINVKEVHIKRCSFWGGRGYNNAIWRANDELVIVVSACGHPLCVPILENS
jgi:hypothetical protein